MSRYLTLAAALSATILCGSARAALMHDPHGDLALSPDWIEVFVDEFATGGTSPTTWGTRDGALSPYAQHSSDLSLPFGELEGRETFWIPRSQPTFYLEGYDSPNPGEAGDRGLTFHTLDAEALGGANYVTVDPAGPGAFTYISSVGTRSIVTDVLPRAPEPSSLILAAVAALGVWRRS